MLFYIPCIGIVYAKGLQFNFSAFFFFFVTFLGFFCIILFSKNFFFLFCYFYYVPFAFNFLLFFFFFWFFNFISHTNICASCRCLQDRYLPFLPEMYNIVLCLSHSVGRLARRDVKKKNNTAQKLLQWWKYLH